ncbi:MAG: CDP-alcohol phosphatidyltransferase family protein [Candidatus Aminicenantes bacterium]|nr:CDP-alcohol phosphatidyltransferase family protein [Candidatus Aminicenantes bacterium]
MVNKCAMADRTKDKFLTLPNLLTLTRLALVPVFLITILRRNVLGAFLVFSLAGLTDFLDGMIARLFDVRTRIGTFLDPMADKLLLSTAFILLTLPGLSSPSAIPLWLTASVLGRDLLIVSGAWVIYRSRGYKNFLPSLLGKISTVFQVATVFVVLLSNCIRKEGWGEGFLSSLTSPSVLSAFFLLTLISTVLSGMHYVFKGAVIFFRPRPD